MRKIGLVIGLEFAVPDQAIFINIELEYVCVHRTHAKKNEKAKKKNEERKRRKKNEIKINRLWYLTSMLNCLLLFYGLCKKVQRIWIILLSFDSFICMNFFCCFIIIIVYEQKKKEKCFYWHEFECVWVRINFVNFPQNVREREREVDKRVWGKWWRHIHTCLLPLL